MKKKHVIAAFSLSIALGLGIFAGAALADRGVKEAKATGETRLYLDMSGFSSWADASATFKVHTWNDAEGDQYHPVTKVGDLYYYADVDLATYAVDGGYRFTRYSSDGNTEWNKGAWCTYAANPETYYKASDWADGTWAKDDQKTWTVVGATNGLWEGGDEDISVPLTFRFNNEGLSFYNTNVNLTAGSVIKIKNSDDAYFGFSVLETGSGSVVDAGIMTGEGDNNITVTKTGSYEFYMKPVSGKAWVQENSALTAQQWANRFLGSTYDICKVGSGEQDHGEALAAAWTDLKADFEDLTMGAKSYVNNVVAGTQDDATVTSAVARYEHIVKRYTTLDLFEGLNVARSRALMPISLVQNNGLLIIIVSSIAAAAAVGLFFVIRRRKHQ